MFPGPTVNQSAGPPPHPVIKIFDYASTSTVVYVGWARSDSPLVTLPSISSFTAANPGVITFSSAHGFNYDATNSVTTFIPVIALSGGTSNWAPANGVWQFIPTSATAGNLAYNNAGTLTKLNTTGFGSVTGTLLAQTRSPQTSAFIWAIQKLMNAPSGATAPPANAIEAWGWAANPTGAGVPETAPGDSSGLTVGSVSFQFSWDQRAAYAYC